jgi:beta-galactosidase GanA
MGLLNPSRGVIDFDGFRALKPLYEAAMAAGIWVVVRPGWSSIQSTGCDSADSYITGPVNIPFYRRTRI